MANVHPFGRPKETRTVTPGGQAATPNVQKETAKTGRQPGDGVGDTATVNKDTSTAKTTSSTTPSKVNKEVWEQARLQVKDTFGGLDEKAQNDAIQARYDSMLASDKQVKDWAGGDKEILGDVGQK